MLNMLNCVANVVDRKLDSVLMSLQQLELEFSVMWECGLFTRGSTTNFSSDKCQVLARNSSSITFNAALTVSGLQFKLLVNRFST